MKLGLDIGGVLIRAGTQSLGQDTFLFSSDYVNAPAVDGVLDAVKLLSQSFELFIISKCGRKIEQRSREWLHANNIDKYIPEIKWNFCKRRHEKAPIATTIGLSAFVDDKLEVLSYMKSVKYKFLFQPKQQEIENYKQHLHTVTVVNDWNLLTDKLLRISRQYKEI